MKSFAKDFKSKLTHTNFNCFSSKNAPQTTHTETNSDFNLKRPEIKRKKTFIKKSKLVISAPTDFENGVAISDFQNAEKDDIVSAALMSDFSREELSLDLYMTHQELMDQTMINRKYANQYYIYNAKQFDGPVSDEVLVDAGYNIFEVAKGSINPQSCRYVIHHLVLKFKTLLTLENKEFSKVMNFWDNFVQTHSKSKRALLRNKIAQLFPWRGCSLQGDIMDKKLDELFGDNVVDVLQALIMIWTEFPQGIIPWCSFVEFAKLECNAQYPIDFFYKKFPECLPDHDYTCVCFEFLEMLRHFVTTNAFKCKGKVVDWVTCCAAVCFKMQERDTERRPFKNVEEWFGVRTKHGEALYHIFLSYLRSLYAENKLKDFYLAQEFDIFDNYPSGGINKSGLGRLSGEQVETSLCISVSPCIDSIEERSASACVTEQIILHCSQAAQQRRYDAIHTFSNKENDFLNAFSMNPAKVFEHLVNENTIQCLEIFDPYFNKKLPFCKDLLAQQKNDRSTMREFYFPQDSQYGVASWIDVGFEQDIAEFFLHSLEYSKANGKKTESGAAFVSKIDMNRWLNNTLEYDIFHKNIASTVLLQFKTRIGECAQLILFLDGEIKQVQPTDDNIETCEQASSLYSKHTKHNHIEEESASVMCQPSLELIDSLDESHISSMYSHDITNSKSKPVPVRVHPYRGSSVSLLLGEAVENAIAQDQPHFADEELHYMAFVAGA